MLARGVATSIGRRALRAGVPRRLVGSVAPAAPAVPAPAATVSSNRQWQRQQGARTGAGGVLAAAAAAAAASAAVGVRLPHQPQPQPQPQRRGLASAPGGVSAPQMDQTFFGSLLGELQAAASASDAEKAAATAQRFPRMPPQPAQIVYNVAVGACVRAGKLELATELLNSLISKGGGQPNLLTYNLLVFGAARTGDWRQAQAFFDEALQAKVRPDASTYHGLIMAYGKGKQPKMVQEVLSQMEARDATTYTTAVAALARCGAWKEALEAAKRADQEDKVAPTAGLYHAAMFACTKGQPAAQWTECLDLLREMKGRGIAVGATAYNTAILCAGIAHETEAAERLLEEMRAGGVAPDNGSYRGVIKSLAKTGDYEKCLALLERMQQADQLEPDLLLFTEAMEVFAKSQNPGATLRVLDQMKGAKQPDLRQYLAPLIDADEAAELGVHEAFVQEVGKLATLRLLD